MYLVAAIVNFMPLYQVSVKLVNSILYVYTVYIYYLYTGCNMIFCGYC